MYFVTTATDKFSSYDLTIESQLRYQKELENVSKQFVRQKIKEECWDQMEVKGRVLSGFHLPVQVTNYSMRERNPNEEKELEFATKQRELEVMEEKTRVEVMKSDLALYASLVGKRTHGMSKMFKVLR